MFRHMYLVAGPACFCPAQAFVKNHILGHIHMGTQAQFMQTQCTAMVFSLGDQATPDPLSAACGVNGDIGKKREALMDHEN